MLTSLLRLSWISIVHTRRPLSVLQYSLTCLQVRADLNVPLDKDMNITDDTRIRAAIPTLKYLTDNGAKVLLTSHLVRTSTTD